MSISNKSHDTVTLTADWNGKFTDNGALRFFNVQHGKDTLYGDTYFPKQMILASKVKSSFESLQGKLYKVEFVVNADRFARKMDEDAEYAKNNPKPKYDTSAFDQFATKIATEYSWKEKAQKISSFRDDELS